MWNKLNKSMMLCQMLFGLSFYGVLVSLTRFFLEDLNYSEADTMMVVGAFAAIGPLFAIAGGFIADKLLGAYRSLTISYLAFVAGYFLLVIGATSLHVPTAMAGIALASYGRGLMSPSYPSLYKRTFSSHQDFEKGFPINYSVNNIGAFLGQYLFPMLVLYIGFSGGFTVSAIMAAVALFVLLVLHKSFKPMGKPIDQAAVSLTNWLIFAVASVAMIALVFFMFSNMDVGQNIVYAIGVLAIVYFIFLMFKVERSESLKMGTILIVTFLTTCFFVYYGQMMTSMNIVAMNTLKGSLFGFIPLEPEAAMAMNPLWCMVGGPIVAFAFHSLEKRGINLSTSTKIAIAFVLTTIAFGILTYFISTVGPDVAIRPEVFLAVHFFQAIAEVVVGSMVVAFILSVAPHHIENFSVSLFSVAIALSGIVGAALSTNIALEKGQVLTQDIAHNVYGEYFQLLTIMAVVMIGVALLCSKLIQILLTKAEQCEQDASSDTKPEVVHSV
ncbi:peptide MFS transporter [Vibrio breoganii]|uniref:peptide MFS transporter n=1 Tax=Vibrio breoganii TaxID=553239 RepID=UPI000C82C3BC|nr:oligopeptide:H+ symporter [Vibrio breoganii]PMM86574.1 major facilitator superfamily transporter [Vibrio breoganii]